MNPCWRTSVGTLLALCVPFGCTGTETGNPPRAVISFQMTSRSPDQFSFDPEGTGALVSHARLGVERLSLQECGGLKRRATEEEFVVQLEGDPDEFEFPISSVCHLELVLSARNVSWNDVRPGDNPALSWGISGVTPGDVPYFIEDTQSISVVFRPQLLELSHDSHLFLQIDVAEVLDYDELVQLSPDPDGALVITEQENSASLDAARSRWAPSWALYLQEGEGVPRLVAGGEEL